MSYQSLTTKRDGAVEYLTLNRPEVRNAFNEDVIDELTHWAARAAEDTIDRGLRVVVLAGAGKVFCAGADVTWMAKTVSCTEEENLRDATAAAHMFAALDSLSVPLIGRIHGAALGGGAGLAAICDIVVAEEHAAFGFTEVKLGILPAVISPFAIAKIGRSAARELFLTGARFSAQRGARDRPGARRGGGRGSRLDRFALRQRDPQRGSRGHRVGQGAHLDGLAPLD